VPLGYALRKQGKLDEAIVEYRKAIELDPKYAGAHNNLGVALMGQGKLDEAIAEYRKAIELDSKYAGAHNNLGIALIRHGKLDQAIAEYRNAIELDPKYAPAHYNLGVAFRDQGKLDEAIASYRKAIELDAKYAPAHNALAWLLATCPETKFRDVKRSVELAKRAVELKPQEGNYGNTLGVAHYRAGSWKEAVAGLGKSMELRKGGDAYDWFFLAMAHWQLSNKADARTWYDKAVEWMEKNQPKDGELRRFRAEAEELMKIERKKD
jgi:Tfp pilus assembly protein PilF